MKLFAKATKGLIKKDESDMEEKLERCIKDSYVPAFRTACFILGNPSDAEEALQEAFLRAWRFRAALTNESNLRPWLYRVVVNACFSRLRKEIPQRERRTNDDLLQQLATSVGVPEVEITGSELRQAVLNALEGLPLNLRIPVILRYYAGLSEQEIATAIRRRQGTVKSRLHEARRRLAEYPQLQSLAIKSYSFTKEQVL
ncbi:MAG: RNA polymerase sigma factor [Actinobacteria bacterium]|nr:RNA polymerase sigma factor [Actinomycetota bacterium]MCL6105407.1 RNA polymerase sigma factor [Actinomycetota bacterium]